MQELLSFEQSPPLTAPLRFFLTAPLFALLAGLLVLFEGETIFASRWMPSALAATHLLTLGFMLLAMLGALIQIFPVVAGANLAHPLRLARIVHLLVSLGTLLLAWAFLRSAAQVFVLAGGLLGLGIAYFLIAAGRALRGVASTSPTIHGIKLALLGLLGTALLGIGLAGALGGLWPAPLPGSTDLHAAWGLAGWAAVLLAAMAYVVVPMFQLTPAYPTRESRALPPLLLLFLALWSLSVLFSGPEAGRVAEAGVAVLGLGFSGRTLLLQRQRRRPRRDALSAYWQSGMVAASLACAMGLATAIYPELNRLRAWSMCFGILIVVGAFMSFINGMMYKIIPFLSWLHLQNAGKGAHSAPPITKLLPDASALRQGQMHQLALGLLLLAALWPDIFARLGGLSLALANVALAWNIGASVRRYHQLLRAMTDGAGADSVA